MNVNSPAAGLLVFNESYDTGWRASVDGRPASICRVNAVVQGVAVPPGRHTLRFAYHPPGLRAGCAWTVAGLLALILAGWATRRLASA